MAKKIKRPNIQYERVLEIREEVRTAHLRNKDKLVAISLKEALRQLDEVLEGDTMATTDEVTEETTVEDQVDD